MNEVNIHDDLAFNVHLIWTSGPPRNPMVRMLLVAIAGPKAVYEGFGTWLAYSCWINELLSKDISSKKLSVLKSALIRDKYAALPKLRIPLCKLESCGFLRVDRE